MPDLDPTAGFAERLLTLLDQASVATTYKYALLLALIDASLEGTDSDGRPAERISVETLADHVLAMYWPHTDPFGDSGIVLRQSGTGQAEIVRDVAQFRQRDPSARASLAAARSMAGFDQLRSTVAWKLAEMPLPRLQRVGRDVDPFLYVIGWDESISRSVFQSASFDRSVSMQPGAAAQLVRLAPLVRPLVERLWAARIVRYNRLPDGQLDDFLFRRSRLDAARVRLALTELQGGRCFYTGRALQASRSDVDHFVPWSRSPVNAIENLVVADARVNNAKRDHLASADHVERWRIRNHQLGPELRDVAAANHWESAPERSLGVARSLYFALGPSNLLWHDSDDFQPADVSRLRAALAS